MNRLHKLITWPVAIIFLSQNIAWTVPMAQPLVISHEPLAIFIPAQYGSVEKSNLAKDRTVILLKDAHCNYEAQTNIAKILDILIRDYKIDLVCVEGAEGIVDTDPYNAFPDQTARDKVSDKYIKKGILSASEALNISKGNKQPFTIWGVEDSRLYLSDFKAFRETLVENKEYIGFLSEAFKSINLLKNKIYNKRLLNFDNRFNEYSNNSISFSEWISYIRAFIPGLGHYKNIVYAVKSMRLEDEIDFKKVEDERTRLIKELEKSLTKEDLQELVRQSLLFKLGKIPAVQYYSYLERYLPNVPKDSTLNLKKYIRSVHIQALIDSDGLFNELYLLESQIYSSLCKDEIERKLHKIDTNLTILNKLLNLQMPRQDLSYYKDHINEFDSKEIAEFINIQCRNNNISITLPSPVDKRESAEKFYELAIERDNVLVNNLLSQMEKAKKRNAALVIGGFHAEGIIKQLEDRGFSYVVISPNITSIQEDNPYLSIMLDEKIDIDKLVENVSGTTLAPPLSLGNMGDTEARRRLAMDLIEHRNLPLKSLLARYTGEDLAAIKELYRIAGMGEERKVEEFITPKFLTDQIITAGNPVFAAFLLDLLIAQISEKPREVEEALNRIIKPILQGSDLGKYLGAEAVDRLSANPDVQIDVFSEGQDIVTEGDPSDSIYLVVSGQLEVSTEILGSIATLGNNMVFGEIGVLTNQVRTATVKVKGSRAILIRIGANAAGALKGELEEFARKRLVDQIERLKSRSIIVPIRDLKELSIQELEALRWQMERSTQAVQKRPIVPARLMEWRTKLDRLTKDEAEEYNKYMRDIGSLMPEEVAIQLLEQLDNLILAQDIVSEQFAYIPINARHVLNTARNIISILEHPNFSQRRKLLEDKYKERLLPALLFLALSSQVGYRIVEVGKPETFNRYKEVGSRMIRDNFGEAIKTYLGEEALDNILDAVEKQGIRKEGMLTSDNPLLFILSIAQWMDNSSRRLSEWQKNPFFIQILSKVTVDNQYIQVKREVEKAYREKSPEFTRLRDELRQLIYNLSSEELEKLRTKKLIPEDEYRQIKRALRSIDLEGLDFFLGTAMIEDIKIDFDTDERLVINVYAVDKALEYGSFANTDFYVNLVVERMQRYISSITTDGVKVNITSSELHVELGEFIERLPMAELHSHLNGAIEFNRQWQELIRLYLAKQAKDWNNINGKNINAKLRDLYKDKRIDLNEIFQTAMTTRIFLIMVLKERGELVSDETSDLELLPLVDKHIKMEEDPEHSDLFIMLRHYINTRNQFRSFVEYMPIEEGKLPEFVMHFAVGSGIGKAGDRERELTHLENNAYHLARSSYRANGYYYEYRINLGKTREETSEEVEAIIRGIARAEEEIARGLRVGEPGFEGRIVLSFGRMGNSPEEYARQASEFVAMLSENPRLLERIVGIDVANQEEETPPEAFSEAFRIIKDYNQTLPEEMQLQMTYHVGEGFTDVSLETSLRFVDEVINYGASRLGHAIILGIDPAQFTESPREELVSERRKTLEWIKNLSEQLGLVYFTRDNIDRELAQLKGEKVLVSYNDMARRDIESLQDYLLKKVIEKNIVIETNPTSNSQIVTGNDMTKHPLRKFLTFSHPATGQRVKFTINTDDAGVFGTDLRREYLRAAKAFGLSVQKLWEIASQGFRAHMGRQLRYQREIEARLRQIQAQPTPAPATVAHMESMQIPEAMRDEHYSDTLKLTDEQRKTIAEVQRGETPAGYTLLTVVGRQFYVQDNILALIGEDAIWATLASALAHEDLKDLPADRPFLIASLNRSPHLFEDHVGNGFIGINEAFFSLYKEISDNPNLGIDIANSLLELGLLHELTHEATGKGIDIEETLTERDAKWLVKRIQKSEKIIALLDILEGKGVLEKGGEFSNTAVRFMRVPEELGAKIKRTRRKWLVVLMTNRQRLKRFREEGLDVPALIEEIGRGIENAGRNLETFTRLEEELSKTVDPLSILRGLAPLDPRLAEIVKDINRADPHISLDPDIVYLTETDSPIWELFETHPDSADGFHTQVLVNGKRVSVIVIKKELKGKIFIKTLVHEAWHERGKIRNAAFLPLILRNILNEGINERLTVRTLARYDELKEERTEAEAFHAALYREGMVGYRSESDAAEAFVSEMGIRTLRRFYTTGDTSILDSALGERWTIIMNLTNRLRESSIINEEILSSLIFGVVSDRDFNNTKLEAVLKIMRYIEEIVFEEEIFNTLTSTDLLRFLDWYLIQNYEEVLGRELIRGWDIEDLRIHLIESYGQYKRSLSAPAHMESMQIPEAMRDEHYSDTLELTEEQSNALAKAQRGEIPKGYTLITVEGRQFYVQDNILAVVGAEVLNARLATALAQGDLKDLPADRPFLIASLNRSPHLFEDHVGNGFIGINEAFLKMYSEADGDEKGFLEILLQLGLEHELMHELTGKGEEIEAEQRKRDIRRMKEELGKNLQVFLMFLYTNGIVDIDFIKEADSTSPIIPREVEQADGTRVIHSGRGSRILSRGIWKNDEGAYVIGQGSVLAAEKDVPFVVPNVWNCVSVYLYDPKSGVYAISHITIAGKSGKDIFNPLLYSQTNITAMVDYMKRLGAWDPASWQAVVIGGVETIPGKENLAAVKKQLTELNILITTEDTGGVYGRNINLKGGALNITHIYRPDEHIKMAEPVPGLAPLVIPTGLFSAARPTIVPAVGTKSHKLGTPKVAGRDAVNSDVDYIIDGLFMWDRVRGGFQADPRKPVFNEHILYADGRPKEIEFRTEEEHYFESANLVIQNNMEDIIAVLQDPAAKGLLRAQLSRLKARGEYDHAELLERFINNPRETLKERLLSHYVLILEGLDFLVFNDAFNYWAGHSSTSRNAIYIPEKTYERIREYPQALAAFLIDELIDAIVGEHTQLSDMLIQLMDPEGVLTVGIKDIADKNYVEAYTLAQVVSNMVNNGQIIDAIDRINNALFVDKTVSPSSLLMVLETALANIDPRYSSTFAFTVSITPGLRNAINSQVIQSETDEILGIGNPFVELIRRPNLFISDEWLVMIRSILEAVAKGWGNTMLEEVARRLGETEDLAKLKRYLAIILLDLEPEQYRDRRFKNFVYALLGLTRVKEIYPVTEYMELVINTVSKLEGITPDRVEETLRIMARPDIYPVKKWLLSWRYKRLYKLGINADMIREYFRTKISKPQLVEPRQISLEPGFPLDTLEDIGYKQPGDFIEDIALLINEKGLLENTLPYITPEELRQAEIIISHIATTGHTLVTLVSIVIGGDTYSFVLKKGFRLFELSIPSDVFNQYTEAVKESNEAPLALAQQYGEWITTKTRDGRLLGHYRTEKNYLPGSNLSTLQESLRKGKIDNEMYRLAASLAAANYYLLFKYVTKEKWFLWDATGSNVMLIPTADGGLTSRVIDIEARVELPEGLTLQNFIALLENRGFRKEDILTGVGIAEYSTGKGRYDLSMDFKPDVIARLVNFIKGEPSAVITEPITITEPMTLRRDVTSEGKVVAIGDVHGELDSLKEILSEAGLIDGNGQWIGGNARVVQLGDIVDRGPDSIGTFKYLLQLQEEARQVGGDVIILLGNHEWAYLAKEGASGMRLTEVLDRARAGQATEEEVNDAGREYFEIRRLILNAVKNGQIKAMYAVGNTIFVHAGIRPIIYALLRKQIAKEEGISVDEVNPIDIADYCNKILLGSVSYKDHFIFRIGNSGESERAGIFWARINEHAKEIPGIRQVIGHSVRKQISRLETRGMIAIDVGIAGHYGGRRAYLEITPEGADRVIRGVTKGDSGTWHGAVITKTTIHPATFAHFEELVVIEDEARGTLSVKNITWTNAKTGLGLPVKVSDRPEDEDINNLLLENLGRLLEKLPELERREFLTALKANAPPEGLVLAILDKSQHLGENCQGDGFIGVNRYLLQKLKDATDQPTIDALSNLLQVILYHELRHEARTYEGDDEELRLNLRDIALLDNSGIDILIALQLLNPESKFKRIADVVNEIGRAIEKYGAEIDDVKKEELKKILLKAYEGKVEINLLELMQMLAERIEPGKIFQLTAEIAGPINRFLGPKAATKGGKMVAAVLQEILELMPIEVETEEDKLLKTIQSLASKKGIDPNAMQSVFDLFKAGLEILAVDPSYKLDSNYFVLISQIEKLTGVDDKKIIEVFSRHGLASEKAEAVPNSPLAQEVEKLGLYLELTNMSIRSDLDIALERRRGLFYLDNLNARIEKSGDIQFLSSVDAVNKDLARAYSEVQASPGGSIIDRKEKITLVVSADTLMSVERDGKFLRFSYKPGIQALLRILANSKNIHIVIRADEQERQVLEKADILNEQITVENKKKELKKIRTDVELLGWAKDEDHVVFLLTPEEGDVIDTKGMKAFGIDPTTAFHTALLFAVTYAQAQTTNEIVTVINTLKLLGMEPSEVDEIARKIKEEGPGFFTVRLVRIEETLKEFQNRRLYIEVAA